MCVAEVMTGDPLTLELEDHLDLARTVMLSCRIRHLPVVRLGRLCGIISARDLAGVLSPAATPARQVMHSPVQTLAPGDPVALAAARLLEHGFSSLPVVEGEQLIGIVTSTDLVRAACELLGDEQVADLMTPAPLVTTAPDDPVGVAQLQMRAAHIRHLPVVDEGRLLGFVSDIELLSAQPDDLVAEVTVPVFVNVTANSGAVAAGRLLVRDRLDALPVLHRNELVGVLSAFDYLELLAA
jgi:acetoin utilization protein AcuB